MTPENFCYWLQGYYEINGGGPLTKEQSAVIMDHLELVFEKKTTAFIPNKWSPAPTFNGKTFIDSWNDYPIAPDCSITQIPVSC